MAPRLETLRGVPGVSVAALVGADGLPLAAVGEGADLLAAELRSLQGSVARLGQRLGVGEVSRLSLTTSSLEVLALSKGDYILGAALIRGIDGSAARQRLAALMDEVLAALPDLPAETGAVAALAGPSSPDAAAGVAR